jgi:hypothetical protein
MTAWQPLTLKDFIVFLLLGFPAGYLSTLISNHFVGQEADYIETLTETLIRTAVWWLFFIPCALLYNYFVYGIWIP